jgi:hypothetical protein
MGKGEGESMDKGEGARVIVKCTFAIVRFAQMFFAE